MPSRVNKEIKLLPIRIDPTVDTQERDDGSVYLKIVAGVPKLFLNTVNGGVQEISTFTPGAGGAVSSSFGSGTNNAITVWSGTGGDSLNERPEVIIDGSTITSTIPLELGSDPATTGDIRLSSSFSITHLNNAGGLDYNVLATDSSDNLNVGSSGPTVALAASGAARFVVNNVSLESRVPSIFFRSTIASPQIYHADDTTNSITGDTLTVHAQNATGTTSTGGDLVLQPGTGTTANGNVTIGGSVRPVTLLLNPSANIDGNIAGTIKTRVSSSGITLYNSTDITWHTTNTAPTLIQQASTVDDHTGAPLIVHAQDVTGGGTTITGGSLTLQAGDADSGSAASRIGGDLVLQSGAGTSANGNVEINAGGVYSLLSSSGDDLFLGGTGAAATRPDITLDAATIIIFRRAGTWLASLDNLQLDLVVPAISFRETVTAPIIRQDDDTTNSITGQSLLIHAQNATGTTTTGGDLTLNAGSGTSADGEINIGNTNTSLINIANGTDNPATVFLGSGDVRINSQLRFAELGGDPTNVANTGFVYAKDDLGVTELYYMDSDGTVTQLTSDGYVDGGAVTGSGNDNEIARWNGTGAIQSSGILIDDSDDMSGATSISIGTTPAASGALRLTNAEVIKSVTTGATDTDLIQLNGSDAVIVGDSAVPQELTSSSTINIRIGGVLRSQFNAGGLSILQNDLLFADSATAPHVYQSNKAASGTGDTFTINAQDTPTAGAANIGGSLVIRAGDATTATTNTGGDLTLRPGSGADANGTITIQDGSANDHFTVTGDNQSFTVGNDSVSSGIYRAGTSGHNFYRSGGLRMILSSILTNYTNEYRFHQTAVSPEIRHHDDTTNSITGDTLTIHAQDCTGTTTTGGDLHLRPGTGTTTNGELELQDSGGVARVRITSSNLVDIAGNINVASTSATIAGSNFSWLYTSSNPNLYQAEDATADAAGDTFTINAQDVSGSGTAITGGTLILRAGDSHTGTATTLNGGDVNIRPGRGGSSIVDGFCILQDASGNDKITVSSGNTVLGANLSFVSSLSAPVINQADEEVSTSSDLMTLKAQTNTVNAGTGGDLFLSAGDGTNGTAGTGGDLLLDAGTGAGSGTDGNIAFFVGSTSPSWNSMEAGMFIANATTVPSGDPTSGGYLYAESGAAKWRGTSGTVTTFGPADPHCPTCGRDTALEWANEKEGWELSICMWCVTDALNNVGIIKKEQI